MTVFPPRSLRCRMVTRSAASATAATSAIAVVVGAAVAAGARPAPLPPNGAEHFQDGGGLLRHGVRARRAVVAAAVVDSAAAVVLQEFLGSGYHLPSTSRARTPLTLCGRRVAPVRDSVRQRPIRGPGVLLQARAVRGKSEREVNLSLSAKSDPIRDAEYGNAPLKAPFCLDSASLASRASRDGGRSEAGTPRTDSFCPTAPCC